MDIYAGIRSRHQASVKRKSGPVSEVATQAERAAGEDDQRLDAPLLKVGLLGDSVRAAGQFQRSALGHMDYEHWLQRVHRDGQRLIDLLAEMGFTPHRGSRNRIGRRKG